VHTRALLDLSWLDHVVGIMAFAQLSTSMPVTKCMSSHSITRRESSNVSIMRNIPLGSAKLALRGSHGGYLRLLSKPSNVQQAYSRNGMCAVASASVDDLPASLKKIVMSFQMVPDPMMRYKQLLYFAKKLKPLPEELHTPENKVEGCVSQVWVYPTLEEGKVYFQADSDSQLTKGLAALLVEGLSGATPEEILKVTPDFVQMLGLAQSLTPSRNNGFVNMLLLMQKKTLHLYAAHQPDQSE